MLSDFANKSDEYYICIPFLQYNENLKKKIESYGYKEFKDFVFTYHKGITLPPEQKIIWMSMAIKLFQLDLFR